MYWLKQVKFRELVDIIIVDMTMPITGLPKKYIEEAKEAKYGGWFFYDTVIRNEYPELINKISLYTGFGRGLMESGCVTQEEYDKLRIIHKMGRESTDAVLEAIGAFEEEKLRNK
jgi:hypothetical protein